MKNDNLINWLGNGLAVIFTSIQTDKLLSLISMGLTILSIIISIAYTIYKWIKGATADGKITPEEIHELGDQLDDINNKIKNKE